jgi:hypothetical protein
MLGLWECPACQCQFPADPDPVEHLVKCPWCARTFTPGKDLSGGGLGTPGPERKRAPVKVEQAPAKLSPGPAGAAVVLLGLCGLVDLALAAALAAQVKLLPLGIRPQDLPGLILGLTLVLLCLAVVTGVAFCVWLYQAYRNLRWWVKSELPFGPALAVLSFFIPFVNLVLPLLVLQVLWKASKPNLPADDPQGWRRARTSDLVTCWWLFWLLAGFLAALPLIERELRAAILPAHLVEALAAGAAILMVRSVRARQEVRFRRWLEERAGVTSDPTELVNEPVLPLLPGTEPTPPAAPHPETAPGTAIACPPPRPPPRTDR